MKNAQNIQENHNVQENHMDTDPEQPAKIYRKAAIIIASLALALIGVFYFICYINGGDMRSVYEAILPYLMCGILALSITLMGISLQR
ncbi:MAG: hypothetical protein ACI4ET_00440 [Bilifractor sp.]